MAERKIRAFLSTDVLLEYLKGKPELRRLFSDEVRERAEFVTDGTAIANLLFASRNGGRDVEPILTQLEIAETEFLTSEMRERFQDKVGPGLLHVNDVITLMRARSSDVLLTYNEGLRNAAPMVAVRTETPEEFFEEIDRAA